MNTLWTSESHLGEIKIVVINCQKKCAGPETAVDLPAFEFKWLFSWDGLAFFFLGIGFGVLYGSTKSCDSKAPDAKLDVSELHLCGPKFAPQVGVGTPEW